MTYFKRGGIHWIALGRWRLSFCRTKLARLPRESLPVDLASLADNFDMAAVETLYNARIPRGQACL